MYLIIITSAIIDYTRCTYIKIPMDNNLSYNINMIHISLKLLTVMRLYYG